MEDEAPVTGVQSTLAEWIGPYVADMLNRVWGLAEAPYEAYGGQLTAGINDNLQSAFDDIGTLEVPTAVGDAATDMSTVAGQIGDLDYTAQDYDNPYASPTNTYSAGTISTDMFSPEYAQQYMNPYLQEALDPMMEESRRQAEISRLNDASRLTQAGAYGGSRQAIMESELNRNLMDKQNQMLTQGYNTAYDKAMQGFMSDQNRDLQAQIAQDRAYQVEGQQGLADASNLAKYGLAADKMTQADDQFAARYGLDALQAELAGYDRASQAGLRDLAAEMDILNEQSRLGQLERAIDQEGISADYAQFQQERDYPYEQLRFMQSFLQGLPITARQTEFGDLSALQEILTSGGSLAELFERLFGGGDDEESDTSGGTDG